MKTALVKDPRRVSAHSFHVRVKNDVTGKLRSLLDRNEAAPTPPLLSAEREALCLALTMLEGQADT